MATERRRQMLLGAVAVVLALVLYRIWPSTSASSAPSSNGRGGATAAVARRFGSSVIYDQTAQSARCTAGAGAGGGWLRRRPGVPPGRLGDARREAGRSGRRVPEGRAGRAR